jgi:hypothetical protein
LRFDFVEANRPHWVNRLSRQSKIFNNIGINYTSFLKLFDLAPHLLNSDISRTPPIAIKVVSSAIIISYYYFTALQQHKLVDDDVDDFICKFCVVVIVMPRQKSA